MNNDNKNANSGKKYGTAYLTFTNLKGSAYKKGNLIVESMLEKEGKNSPLCKLASFTDMIVEDCALNESKTGTNISVCVNAIGEDNMKRLYEWLKKYTNEAKISEIAPGLLESLGLTNNEEQVNEDSVASRFSKYRKLYEADDEEEPNKDDKDDENTDKDGEDKNSDSAGESKKEEDGDDPEDSDGEEEELTAVIIEVKKGDEDAAKQEMIDAGVDEDDIEILEPEKDDDEGDDEGDNTDEDNAENESEDDDKDTKDDSSDETVKIKVSIDSLDALKSYLEDKGFDLEEELGGEIVTDDDDEDSEGDDDEKEKDEMEDTFDGFDDLFGDMGDDENDEKK